MQELYVRAYRRHPFGSRQGNAFLKQKRFKNPNVYLVVFIHHVFFKYIGTFLALLNTILSDFEGELATTGKTLNPASYLTFRRAVLCVGRVG